MIPSLVALRFSPNVSFLADSGTSQPVRQEAAWVGIAAGLTDCAVFTISLVVAIAAAIEEFFNFGEKHRNYRKAAEAMKGEYWQFLQLSGHYSKYQEGKVGYAQAIKAAYSMFVQRIEQIIEEDVRSFIELIDEQVLEDNRQTKQTLQETTLAVDSLMAEIKRVSDRLEAIDPTPVPHSSANTASKVETPHTLALSDSDTSDLSQPPNRTL